MLTAFTVDDQDFRRIGSEQRLTASGRKVRVGLWASACPDCGMVFVQAHRDRGLIPGRSTKRRCKACTKGPGRPVRRSVDHAPEFPAPLPAHTELPSAAFVTHLHGYAPGVYDKVDATFFRPIQTPPRAPATPRPAGLFTDR